MTASVKKFTVPELEKEPTFGTLLIEYAEESAIGGMPPPSARLEIYRVLDKSGSLHTFGAFLDGELVGFLLVVFTILPHYSTCAAVVESFFVAKVHRKSGAGTKLRQAAERLAESIGAAGLLISAPYGGILAEVLPHVGYVETNRVFFKKVSNA